MLCQLRVHSPCGANVPVSNPNQLTPVRATLWPLASKSWLPEACSGPAIGLPPRFFRPGMFLPASPTMSANATSTGIRIEAIRPSRGRFRKRVLSDANMILQKNRQQISDAGILAHVAIETGVETATHAGRVVVVGQGDQSNAGIDKVHVAGDERRADIRRLHINEEHLRPVNPGQSNRLHTVAGRRDDMKTRLLANQVDKRLQHFRMVADDDYAIVWNSSSHCLGRTTPSKIGAQKAPRRRTKS